MNGTKTSEDAWIYEKTADNKARFLLGKKGSKTLICIGINPSTAEPNNLDNTVKTVERFAARHGYDSWLMLNVYPQRATDPNKLDKELNKAYHEENIRQIRSILQEGRCGIWAAWGTLIRKRGYLLDCLRDIREAIADSPIQWYTAGRRSKEGDPHHPLYLRNNEPFEEFDIDEYLGLQKKQGLR